MKKLSTKIWLLTVGFLIGAVAFSFFIADYLYEQLYVESIEQSMIEVGEKLQTKYIGGSVTDQLISEIEDYNTFAQFDLLAVRNPKELSACVPFEIDYDALIGPKERATLLEGKYVSKIGFEPRFDRQIISVVLPFTDQNRLEGIIYIYYPLAKITELATEKVILFIVLAVLFMLVFAYFNYYVVKRILRPLDDLQHAVDEMSRKNYTARVIVSSDDEVGQLSKAFNHMAHAIQQEDEAQRSFLATVSHELRTPISYVKGYSEAIQNGYIPEQDKEATIQLISREANRMQRITNDLLQLAREGNDEQLDKQPIVLSEVIRDVASLLQGQRDSKLIKLNLELDEELIIYADEEKLKQVFINVIENAIRYSQQASNIVVQTKALKQDALVEFIDTGIGIPQEDLPYITERFYRVNKARSRTDGGSGLGLSIVSTIVKQHNGTLKIESVENKGTHVIITFPLMED